MYTFWGFENETRYRNTKGETINTVRSTVVSDVMLYDAAEVHRRFGRTYALNFKAEE
jgi:hypothetical protein